MWMNIINNSFICVLSDKLQAYWILDSANIYINLDEIVVISSKKCLVKFKFIILNWMFKNERWEDKKVYKIIRLVNFIDRLKEFRNNIK